MWPWLEQVAGEYGNQHRPCYGNPCAISQIRMQYLLPGMIIQRHPDPQQDKDICRDDGRLKYPLQPMKVWPIILKYQKTA